MEYKFSLNDKCNKKVSTVVKETRVSLSVNDILMLQYMRGTCGPVKKCPLNYGNTPSKTC